MPLPSQVVEDCTLNKTEDTSLKQLIKLVEGLKPNTGGGGAVEEDRSKAAPPSSEGDKGDEGDKGKDAKLDLGPLLKELLSKHSDAWTKIMKEEISKIEIGRKAPLFSCCSGTDAVSPVPKDSITDAVSPVLKDSITELLALVKLLTSAERDREQRRFWWLDEIKSINDTLAHHLPMEIAPVGPAVLRVEKVVNYHLPLEWKGIPLEPVGPAVLALKMVDNTNSIKHIEKMLVHHIPLEWNRQPLPKAWEEFKFIRETLVRHLPLEWKGSPLEPVGPAMLHVERIINRHIPLDSEPVGAIIVKTWTHVHTYLPVGVPPGPWPPVPPIPDDEKWKLLFEQLQKILGIVEVNGKILGHHLPLTRNGSSLDPVGPLISDTLTRHLPLEWKGSPLEPVGPAVLHVERIVNHHLLLEIEPVGPKPLIERIGELEKLVRDCCGRSCRLPFQPF